MNKMIMIVAAAIVAGCCSQECAKVGAGTEFPGVKDSGTTYMRDALKPFIESGELPGCIEIMFKDGVQETACLGYANVETRRPISLDDHFMQCSQTKGFCGVTIAKLVEEGKIKLDDPVSKYLPEFKVLYVGSEQNPTNETVTLKRAKNELTIRMCLNHTGGFPFELNHYCEMGGWSRRMPLRSVAVMAATHPVMFEPGTKQSYSNVGIDIGAAIVEVVTGMRWEDYLEKTVLRPLGMNDSTFHPTDAMLATKIEMYDCVEKAPAKWREFNPSMGKPYGDDRVFASAGAGLWTTARDQYKFYKMLMNLGMGDNGARVLKSETVKSLLATSTRPKGLGGYSLGLWASENGEDGWFGHGGAWGTNCTVNWKTRELRLNVVQLCGGPRPWWNAEDNARKLFSKADFNSAASREYQGRLK